MNQLSTTEKAWCALSVLVLYIKVPQLGTLATRGSQRDVVYFGRPIAPSYMSPNAGWGVARSQPMITAVHILYSPNKL
jgi:hypothetical protein